jgi:hypothetical protein
LSAFFAANSGSHRQALQSAKRQAVNHSFGHTDNTLTDRGKIILDFVLKSCCVFNFVLFLGTIRLTVIDSQRTTLDGTHFIPERDTFDRAVHTAAHSGPIREAITRTIFWAEHRALDTGY